MRNGLRIAAIIAAIPMAALAQRGGRMGGQMPGLGPTYTPQQPLPSGPVIQLRAATRVVEIEVSAQGGNGQPADNLKRADFTVFDNGHPRPFTIFSFNSGTAAALTPVAPRAGPVAPAGTFSNLGAAPTIETQHSTIFLIDAFNGWFENFANARSAVLEAMDQVPGDERIALYVISRYQGLLLLQDYTTNRAQLRQAITKYIPAGTCPAAANQEPASDGVKFEADMGPPPPAAADDSEANNGAKARAYADASKVSPCVAGAKSVIDAADAARLSLSALAASLQSLPGRKSVFWITQGFPPALMQDSPTYGGNKDPWDKTLAQLNDANVAVNTLDSNGLDGPPRLWGPGGVLSQQQVATATGGQSFYNNGDLGAVLARGVNDARSSYTLGFYLDKLDRKYHSLKVVVDRPGVTLTYRHGYYAEDDAQRAGSHKKADLGAALLNPAGETGVGITVWIQPAGTTLDLTVNLAPSSLTVRAGNGGWLGQVDELFVERNADGRELGRETDTKRFQMTARGRSQVAHDGLNLKRSLRLAPGATALEIVIRDHDSGRIGSINVPVPPAPASVSPAKK